MHGKRDPAGEGGERQGEQRGSDPILGEGEALLHPADRGEPRWPGGCEGEFREVGRAERIAGAPERIGQQHRHHADRVGRARGRGQLACQHSDAEEGEPAARQPRGSDESTGAVIAGDEKAERAQHTKHQVRQEPEHRCRQERGEPPDRAGGEELAAPLLFVRATMPGGEKGVHESPRDGEERKHLEPQQRSRRIAVRNAAQRKQGRRRQPQLQHRRTRRSTRELGRHRGCAARQQDGDRDDPDRQDHAIPAQLLPQQPNHDSIRSP